MKKRFIIRLSIFLFLFFLMTYLFIYCVEHFTNTFTKESAHSNLVSLKKNQTYDVVFLGTSHAISIFGNKETYEKTSKSLGKKYVTLANAGNGVVPQKLYLSYFFDEGNKTRYIIYFLDPWALYYSQWNEENYYIAEEVFRLRFLSLMLQNGLDRQVPLEYIRSKFTYMQFMPSQQTAPKSLSQKDVTPTQTQKTISHYYFDSLKEMTFRKYTEVLEGIIKLSQKNHAKMIFIIPPTLIANLPGMQREREMLKSEKKKYGIEYFDYALVFKDPSLFRDLDHLHPKGAEIFVKQFIKPLIQK